MNEYAPVGTVAIAETITTQDNVTASSALNLILIEIHVVNNALAIC